MTDIPDCLTLKRNRDLEGMHRHGVWIRRAVIALIGVVCIVGLVNFFGQRPESARAEGPVASLAVYAPNAIRGGDFMEARFHIHAKQDIKKATLKLDPGWAEGMSLNTIEPSPIGQASDNGRLSFDLGHIPAGQSFILFMQFQVNPTNVAWHRPQNVDLYDGSTPLLHVHHTISVFP